MMEVGVVVSSDGTVLHWHVPPGRSSASLPDSRTLWDVFWANRETIAGFAHTHPGSGRPAPSHEDVTTFSAIELGLGRRYLWWIATTDGLVVARFVGPDRYDYQTEVLEESPPWLEHLRVLSEEDKK